MGVHDGSHTTAARFQLKLRMHHAAAGPHLERRVWRGQAAARAAPQRVPRRPRRQASILLKHVHKKVPRKQAHWLHAPKHVLCRRRQQLATCTPHERGPRHRVTPALQRGHAGHTKHQIVPLTLSPDCRVLFCPGSRIADSICTHHAAAPTALSAFEPTSPPTAWALAATTAHASTSSCRSPRSLAPGAPGVPSLVWPLHQGPTNPNLPSIKLSPLPTFSKSLVLAGPGGCLTTCESHCHGDRDRSSLSSLAMVVSLATLLPPRWPPRSLPPRSPALFCRWLSLPPPRAPCGPGRRDLDPRRAPCCVELWPGGAWAYGEAGRPGRESPRKMGHAHSSVGWSRVPTDDGGGRPAQACALRVTLVGRGLRGCCRVARVCVCGSVVQQGTTQGLFGASH